MKELKCIVFGFFFTPKKNGFVRIPFAHGGCFAERKAMGSKNYCNLLPFSGCKDEERTLLSL